MAHIPDDVTAPLLSSIPIKYDAANNREGMNGKGGEENTHNKALIKKRIALVVIIMLSAAAAAVCVITTNPFIFSTSKPNISPHLHSKATLGALPPRFNFSWDTLPVFFHSANASGPWNDAATSEIGRYGMATFEKQQSQGTNPGMTQEENIPVACRQIKAVNNGSTFPTLYYLNSVLDWGTSSLHQLLIDHPHYRLKDAMGQDIIAPLPGSPWCFNLSVPALREAWILDCLNTVTPSSSDGCDGCFVDRSNNMTEFHVTTSAWNMSLPDAMQFEVSHMHTLSELNTRLAAMGGFAVSNNQGLSEELGTSSIMFEDFTGSEHCITSLRRAASSGLVVQVHAGYYVDDGSNDTVNGCGSGDTNAMAAFLIGMGNYTYYHCSRRWTSDRRCPDAG